MRHDIEFRDERRTCWIIASGESAGQADLRAVADHPWVYVNDAWRLEPAEPGRRGGDRRDPSPAEIAGRPERGFRACYGADRDWWKIHGPEIKRRFEGECWTQDAHTARELKIEHIQLERAGGLSTEPGKIRSGGIVANSGAQAINLAYLFGARRLVLVGFDMKGGHFFGEHPRGLRNHTPYETFVRHMGEMAADLDRLGVEVLNASPASALPYWRRCTVEQAIGA